MKKLCRYAALSSLAAAMLMSTGCTSTTDDASSSTIAYNEATTPHYDVVLREDAAAIDGNLDDAVWADVPSISGGFHFPWDTKEAPLTVFKGYHDGTDFYFCFEVHDENVVSEEEWKEDESTVDNEDRVELFLAGGSIDKPTTEGMPLYYGVEIDPQGRVHDYSIEYYRHFDGTWNLEGLDSAGVATDDGYIVEGKVPMASLQDLDLIHDNVMRAGVYRAEFSLPAEDGELVQEWISWIDPKTEAPDYHVDSSFGEFRFPAINKQRAERSSSFPEHQRQWLQRPLSLVFFLTRSLSCKKAGNFPALDRSL